MSKYILCFPPGGPNEAIAFKQKNKAVEQYATNIIRPIPPQQDNFQSGKLSRYTVAKFKTVTLNDMKKLNRLGQKPVFEGSLKRIR